MWDVIRDLQRTGEVLIHDLKMRLEIWSPVWEMLREDGHRLVAADLPGWDCKSVCVLLE